MDRLPRRSSSRRRATRPIPAERARRHLTAQPGSGTPIGLPAGHSPAATTARRTGPSSSASRSQPGVAERLPRAAAPAGRCRPRPRPPMARPSRGERVRRPASRGGQPARRRRPRPRRPSRGPSAATRAVLRPAAAASTWACDAVDLPLHQRDGVPVAAVLAQGGQRLPQRQVRLRRAPAARCWRRPAGGRAASTAAAAAAARSRRLDAPRPRRSTPRRAPGGPRRPPRPAGRRAPPPGVAASHTAGTRRATKAGAKLTKVAVTTSGPTAPSGAARQAK